MCKAPPQKLFSFQPLVLRPWKNSDSSTFQVLLFAVSETVSCRGDISNAYFSTCSDVHMFAWAHLCSRSVAWISQTLTKDRRFLSSVQFSDKQMLPIVWASSRSLDACVIWTLQTLDDTRTMKKKRQNRTKVVGLTCFSTCSAGQPCTCLMRFSLKWEEREGVREQEVRAAEVVEGAEAEQGALLTLEEAWLGPGEGLLWLLR